MNKLVFTFKRSQGGIFVLPDVMTIEIIGWTNDELNKILEFVDGLADRDWQIEQEGKDVEGGGQ